MPWPPPAATQPDVIAAVCVFASIGPYGEPGLDWAEGLGGDATREEIRRFFEEPERARAEYRDRSAITLAQRVLAGVVAAPLGRPRRAG